MTFTFNFACTWVLVLFFIFGFHNCSFISSTNTWWLFFFLPGFLVNQATKCIRSVSVEKCDSIQALSMLFYINSSILAVSMIWNSHMAEICRFDIFLHLQNEVTSVYWGMWCFIWIFKLWVGKKQQTSSQKAFGNVFASSFGYRSICCSLLSQM